MASNVGRVFCRKISTSAPLKNTGHSASAGHANPDLWKKAFLFIGIPAIGLGMVNAYLGHQADHGKPREPFVPYEYMRIRTKPFPWGDGNHSLFHNPKVNPLPDGYEVEDDAGHH